MQTGPVAHPASYTVGTGSFFGVKKPGRGVNHPRPSSVEVKERVELYLYFPSEPSWPDLERTLPLLLRLFYRRFVNNEIHCVACVNVSVPFLVSVAGPTRHGVMLPAETFEMRKPGKAEKIAEIVLKT
jgi:hypothetical protein